MVGKWKVVLSKDCDKDAEKLRDKQLTFKAQKLTDLLTLNPFTNSPSYEKLKGYTNRYSRRIDIKHRMVYEVNKTTKTVRVLRMWTHYSDN
jgi:Txe/YoeB family toxin of toxin-antitoxin system